MAAKTNAEQIANKFLSEAAKDGYKVTVKQNGQVTVTKSFRPYDKSAFVECDMTGPSLLALLGAKGGSQWGTDGGSVGGHSALIHGQYTLNQSGVSARVTSALIAALNARPPVERLADLLR